MIILLNFSTIFVIIKVIKVIKGAVKNMRSEIKQLGIFDFLSEVPELSKSYSVYIKDGVAWYGSSITVKEVDEVNCTATFDVVSHRYDKISQSNVPYLYSLNLTFGEFDKLLKEKKELLSSYN